MTFTPFELSSSEGGPVDGDQTETEAVRETKRATALVKVLDTFTLESDPSAEAGAPLFTTSVSGPGRLYGGTSFALSYLAAAATVEPRRQLHSITGTFLRTGRSDADIACEVALVRDGRSFSNRRVQVRQGKKELFEGTAGFRTPMTDSPSKRTGIGHAFATMPSQLPSPGECCDREQERTRRLGVEWLEHPVNAVEVRVTDPRHLVPEVKLPPRAVNWVRVPGTGSLSATQRTAFLLYASDRALLSTAALPHGILWSKNQAVTLNHSLWIHQVPDPSRWHLFVAESRIAVGGLALIQLEIFTESGTLVASAVQEALVQY